MKRSFFRTIICCLTILTMTTFTGCSGDDAVTSDKDVVTLPGVESIVGTWREDSEYGINILTVNEDSSYALYHTSGGKESGKVVIDSDVHSDGTYDSWFSFYDESGELWTGFPNMAEYTKNPPSELISESVDRMKFVRIDENEKTPAKDYVGIWGCGRCTITITKAKDNYKANVIWGSSAFESSEWNYNCHYDEESATLICNSNATLVNHKYNNKGKDKKTTVYKDGSGSFIVRGGVLRWTDNKESAGKELYFAYSPVQE